MSSPPSRSISRKALFGILAAVVLLVAPASWLSYGIYISGQAERNLHATLFTISLVDRFVATRGRWPQSWEELEQVAITDAAPEPLNNKTTAVRIGGAHGYDWPASSQDIQRRVFIDFNADATAVANQRPMTFEGNRSHVGEQGGSSFLTEFGLHGLCQPVEDVAVPATTGFDHR
jgi:hypothetical protein